MRLEVAEWEVIHRALNSYSLGLEILGERYPTVGVYNDMTRKERARVKELILRVEEKLG